mmetsp:Transcript_1225/g.2032  ORF Transcript_1225/g.2032 Transcript_1225/m.2032 type:complete len:244 (-) Transcript_1225:929-1660(-)
MEVRRSRTFPVESLLLLGSHIKADLSMSATVSVLSLLVCRDSTSTIRTNTCSDNSSRRASNSRARTSVLVSSSIKAATLLLPATRIRRIVKRRRLSATTLTRRVPRPGRTCSKLPSRRLTSNLHLLVWLRLRFHRWWSLCCLCTALPYLLHPRWSSKCPPTSVLMQAMCTTRPTSTNSSSTTRIGSSNAVPSSSPPAPDRFPVLFPDLPPDHLLGLFPHLVRSAPLPTVPPKQILWCVRKIYR